VHGRLTRDELDARTGQALAARTYADLAALTADLPAADAPATYTVATTSRPPTSQPQPGRRGPPAVGRWPGRSPGRAAA